MAATLMDREWEVDIVVVVVVEDIEPRVDDDDDDGETGIWVVALSLSQGRGHGHRPSANRLLFNRNPPMPMDGVPLRFFEDVDGMDSHLDSIWLP